jgi:hypothetical protein
VSETPSPADAAWQVLAGQLAEHLAVQWPAMPERLGPRYAAFVEHALQQGEQRGLLRFGAAARYANLCFVWGPSFQDRPGFEWASNLLTAPSSQDWATSHRMVQRSLAELARLPDRRIAPELLELSDERLVERFGGFDRRLAMAAARRAALPLPTPRRACDLEAIECRLLSLAVELRYLPDGAAGFSREAIALPPPLRATLTKPAPALLAALSVVAGEAGATRLQLRAAPHAHCDDRVHPALNFDGSHGRWAWIGHETKAVSWPLHTLEQPEQVAGPGTRIAEETSPEIHKLSLATCGLRDDGEPMGSVELQAWVWPAAQWWMQWQRSAPAAVAEGPNLAPAAAMRCQVERDGLALDAAALRQGFEQGLDAATAAAWSRLLQAWSQGEALRQPADADADADAEPAAAADLGQLGMARGEALLALLVGRAAATWGWQLGDAGLAARAFMRLRAEVDLQALVAQIRLEAELARGGATARVSLQIQTTESAASPEPAAPGLRCSLSCESAATPPRAAAAAAVVRWRLPWTVEVVPLASEDGALLLTAGPCRGALVGEAGLRPRSNGGTGLEWFAGLRCEAVVVPMSRLDPLLGDESFEQPLLPALDLLAWSQP